MNETFSMTPAGSGPLWFLVGLMLILLPILALFGYLAYSSKTAQFEVSPQGLRISGIMYGRRIPADQLAVDQARVVDLKEDRDLRVKWRTNGAGLPGLAAGWFKLANKEKALMFVTDQRHVVYLPTRKGYVLLLSVADPEAFLVSLRRIKGV